MAINEACQVWIEQRIQEELSGRGDSGKSLREIGRELAAEIERVFEARVNPMTLANRASRVQRVSFDTHDENPAPPTAEAGDAGDKLHPQEVVKKIDRLVEMGRSVREAAEVVAEETGKKAAAVRKAYARERERQKCQSTASEAWQFAEIAISQLGRIRDDDPGRIEAFGRVRDWINKKLEV